MHVIFKLLLFLLLVIIIILVSSIKINIKKFIVKECAFKNFSSDEVDFVFKIITSIQEEKYDVLLNLFDIYITADFVLFGFIPIHIFKLNNNKLEFLIKKRIKKSNNLKLHDVNKYNRKKAYEKKLNKLIINNIGNIKFSDICLNIYLGLDDAKYTAIMCGALNLVSTIFLLATLYDNQYIPKIKLSENMINVHPIYNSGIYFSSDLKMIVSFNLFTVMNNFISSVNNTRKVKLEGDLI